MKKMLKQISAVILTLILGVVLLAPVTLAQSSSSKDDFLWGNKQTKTAVAGTLGLGTKDLRVTIAQIIKVALSMLGIIAVVIILIGGFKWMTAGGDENKVGEAKKWITSGIIGLAIILSSYAIANFVISSLIEATTK